VGAGESKEAVKPDATTEAMDEAPTAADVKPDIKAAEGDAASKSDAPAPAAAAASETVADH
jgi:hypothetical protein